MFVLLLTAVDRLKSKVNEETSDLSDDSDAEEEEKDHDIKSDDEWIEAGKGSNQPGIANFEFLLPIFSVTLRSVCFEAINLLPSCFESFLDKAILTWYLLNICTKTHS